MIKTSNTKCRQYTQSQTPFKANNLEGRIEGDFYIVYSYKWYPLFAYSFTEKGWYENVDKYSVSTSRQTSQSRPMSSKETTPLCFQAMKDLLK